MPTGLARPAESSGHTILLLLKGAVGCAIGRVPIERAARHLWPFWLAMLVVLILATYVPALSLWVPSLVYPQMRF